MCRDETTDMLIARRGELELPSGDDELAPDLG
jgi:hypothetical protein